jgi:hypothetical protein
MSKRKNRKKNRANIPSETLQRARQEAGLEAAEQEETEAVPADETPEPVAERAPVAEEAPARATASRSAGAASTRRKQRTGKLKYEEMTREDVVYLLEHPTKTVSTEELHRDYSYVIADLRSMAILAAILFVTLIVLASVFV